MKDHSIIAAILLMSMLNGSCSKALYKTDGESIYQSGKNLAGTHLLDKKNSRVTVFKSCKGCHGSSGTRISDCNIQWSYLSDPSKMKVPYTRELFFRFLDEDLKSDGTEARTGVHWKMSPKEKEELIAYLKALQ